MSDQQSADTLSAVIAEMDDVLDYVQDDVKELEAKIGSWRGRLSGLASAVPRPGPFGYCAVCYHQLDKCSHCDVPRTDDQQRAAWNPEKLIQDARDSERVDPMYRVGGGSPDDQQRAEALEFKDYEINHVVQLLNVQHASDGFIARVVKALAESKKVRAVGAPVTEVKQDGVWMSVSHLETGGAPQEPKPE